MTRCFLVLCSFLLCAIFGCSTPSQKQGRPDQSLSLQIRIHADEAGPLVHIWMQPVAGGVYGVPAGKVLVDKRVRDFEKFPVSLVWIESALAAAAKTTKPYLLTYDPAETQIARLGTMSINLSNPALKYGTGLRDPTSGHILVLIYVDRPCSIHGTNVEVILPGPGLHWLELLDSPNGANAPAGGAKPFKLREPPQDVIYDLTQFTST